MIKKNYVSYNRNKITIFVNYYKYLKKQYKNMLLYYNNQSSINEFVNGLNICSNNNKQERLNINNLLIVLPKSLYKYLIQQLNIKIFNNVPNIHNVPNTKRKMKIKLNKRSNWIDFTMYLNTIVPKIAILRFMEQLKQNPKGIKNSTNDFINSIKRSTVLKMVLKHIHIIYALWCLQLCDLDLTFTIIVNMADFMFDKKSKPYEIYVKNLYYEYAKKILH